MNDNKGDPNDFSSLFLPDLLRSFSTTNQDMVIKQEDENLIGALFSDPRSNLSNDSSNPLALFEQDSDPATFAPYDQIQVSQNNANNQGNIQNFPHQNSSRRQSPFTGTHDDGVRLTSHYADMIPVEAAGYQPQSIRHMNQNNRMAGNNHLSHNSHVIPIQPALSSSTVIGQFDGINYFGGMSPQYPSQMMPQSVPSHIDFETQPNVRGNTETPDPTEFLRHYRSFPPPSNIHPSQSPFSEPVTDSVNGSAYQTSPDDNRQNDERQGDKLGAENPSIHPEGISHSRVNKPEKPAMEFDYSTEKLLRLVDLKASAENTHPIFANDNQRPVEVDFASFLTGRFYTNDQDNINFISVKDQQAPTEGKSDPQVVSCYRRNFIRFNIKFQLKNDSKVFFDQTGDHIQKFRIDILAFVDDKDQTRIPVIINRDKDPIKDSNKHTEDSFVPFYMDINQEIEPQQSTQENYFCVRKAQFKKATANSGNLSFQTFFRFHVRLVAITEVGQSTVKELVSAPIVVRGRNPSFYYKRRDVLIPSRTPNSKSSFDLKKTIEFQKASGDEAVGFEEERGNSPVPEEKSNSVSADAPEDPQPTKPSDTEQRQGNVTPLGSKGLNSAINLKELLDPKSFVDADGKPSRYRYFPISNVYYLPPINVVYFPHGAHQSKRDMADATEDSGTDMEKPNDSPISARKADKKRNVSKVYFK